MKWILCSERLPDEVAKRYCLRLNNGHKYIGSLMWSDKSKGLKAFYSIDKPDWNNYKINNVYQWLDESEPLSDGQDERVWDEFKSDLTSSLTWKTIQSKYTLKLKT